MCTENCIQFGKKAIKKEEIASRRVLEVGSYNYNGSLRGIIEQYGPREYVGADIIAGRGVDILCSAESLIEHFGEESFDFVVSTELLEHVRDWRVVIHNMKGALNKGGIILLTTRSRGFHYHAYPHDYWRFEEEDMRRIFSDFEILLIEKEEKHPGIFIKAKKGNGPREIDLSSYKLYSIVTGRHSLSISHFNIFVMKTRHLLKRIFYKIVKGTDSVDFY